MNWLAKRNRRKIGVIICFEFSSVQSLSPSVQHFMTQWTAAWFPGVSADKESACHAGDLGSIPGLGRSPGEGNGNLLQYSCSGSPIYRASWWAKAHTVTRVGRDLATKPPLPAQKPLRISRQWQQSTTPSMEPAECRSCETARMRSPSWNAWESSSFFSLSYAFSYLPALK